MLSLLLSSNIENEKYNFYMTHGYVFETVLDTITSNSEIHIIKSVVSGETFISKVYDIYGLNQEDLNKYMNELNIMKTIDNCNNVVKVIDCIKTDNSLCFIFEFCNQGDLYSDILRRKINNEMYTEEEILNILRQILNGLNTIHKNKIVHADLKSSNIFIKNDMIKIGDFGISQIGTNNNLGTINCLSYESIKFQKTNQVSDLFQVGCILYELATLSSAFLANTTNEMIACFENQNYNNIIIGNISSNYSQNLVNIISKLLSLNTLERLNVVKNINTNQIACLVM